MAHPGIVFLDDNGQPQASHHQSQGRRRCCAGFNTFGIIGSLFSVLGVFTFGLASPIGLLFSLLGMWRRPRGAATFGTILGGLGTAFLALWGWAIVAGINAVEYEHQQQRTELVLEQGVETIESYRAEYDALPGGIDGNKLLISAELNDPWGQALRYDPGDSGQYLIRSAGPDGEFDTRDDLTMR